ncbi:hypothetical protein TBR22_A06860 [Luteitalea sp. TBR-22]|uniref:hypothetical protein n=1 Tax=Luteitalea sp. TBR-22 TaxID=2802971 RepID=UPI001AF7F261|nr:hypothetical protein [Luteitalea sp. TBR-22]BCS31485.1 hypothetical protein TBR22_A06860 [Luteitalea sp. TBR-22]
MTEEQVRALVRDALARHLDSARAGTTGPAAARACVPAATSLKSHLAFGRFVSLAPTEPDAPCVVEPQVTCHHCGFCQSYGH